MTTKRRYTLADRPDADLEQADVARRALEEYLARHRPAS